MRSVFFSDLHLMKNDRGAESYFLSFIDEIGDGADRLYILGDLFEFCFGKGGHIYPWFREVFRAFERLAGQGTKIFFLEGNHEFFMEGFGTAGPVTFIRTLSETMGGTSVFLSHGHEFTSPFLNGLLRSSLVSSLMTALGPDRTWQAAMVWRRILSQKEKGYDQSVRPVFRRYAERKFSEGFGVVIFGHSHMADRYEYTGGTGQGLYFNTGDFRAHGTYVEYTDQGGFELKRFHSTSSHKLRTINDV